MGGKEELEEDLAAGRRPLRKVGKVPELVFGRASSTEWMKRRRQNRCLTVGCGKVVQPCVYAPATGWPRNLPPDRRKKPACEPPAASRRPRQAAQRFEGK